MDSTGVDVQVLSHTAPGLEHVVEQFLRTVPPAPTDRRRLAAGNAAALLKLELPD